MANKNLRAVGYALAAGFVTELTLVFPPGACYDAPEEGESRQTGAKEVAL